MTTRARLGQVEARSSTQVFTWVAGMFGPSSGFSGAYPGAISEVELLGLELILTGMLCRQKLKLLCHNGSSSETSTINLHSKITFPKSDVLYTVLASALFQWLK